MSHAVTLIADYRGAFYSSITNGQSLCSMDVGRLVDKFLACGVTADVIGFSEVDFRRDWEGRVVLYQSSEDHELRYRSYIEDILLGLSLAGARLLPDFPFLRAHHNKVFMEVLRQVSRVPEAHSLKAFPFGTLEDFLKASLEYPLVLKSAAGAGSSGVRLCRNAREARTAVKRMSGRSGDFLSVLKELVKRVVRKGYTPYSLHRRKFVLQEFIPGLQYDYKVLIYGSRLFVVRREVRARDFRASGSGMLNWPRSVPERLMDFAWRIYQGFDVPHISLDIAEAGERFHLIEVQFVDFGPAALERSNCHWRHENGQWCFVDGPAELESTFVEGVLNFCLRKGWIPL